MYRMKQIGFVKLLKMKFEGGSSQEAEPQKIHGHDNDQWVQFNKV